MPTRTSARSIARIHDALRHDAVDKRLLILRLIGECGSISQAARRAGVSYKAAWQAVDTLGNLAGANLVERAVGGAGGGGATLSAAGRQLLQAAERLEQARQRVLRDLVADGAGKQERSVAGVATLGLRTSMRNQVRCVVRRTRGAGGAVTVLLATPDGTPIASRITRESAQLLDLKPGREVLALFKATAVAVAPSGDAGADDRNRLTGRVARSSRARAGGEVALRLPGGETVVGFCSAGTVLRMRDTAVAAFDAAAVVVALPG